METPHSSSLSESAPLLLIHPIGVGLSSRFWDRFIRCWRLHDPAAVLLAPDLISVSSGLTLRAGTTDQYITTCRISRPEGESWAPVDPDSKELLQLCEIYGKDYILNPPDAAAENQLLQRGQAGK